MKRSIPFLALLASACVSNDYSPPPREQGSVAADVATVEASDGPFAFEVLRRMRETAGQSNTLVSPYALRIQLAMEHVHEEGEARAQVATAGGFTLPSPALDSALDAVDLTLAGRKGAEGGPPLLGLARSLWWQNDVDWGGGRKDFFDDISRYYGATVHFIDLSGDQSPIDAWASANSGDSFHSSMDSTCDNLWVLMSAVSMNARWGTPTTSLGPAPFSAIGGPVSHPFFAMEDELPFASTNTYEAVQLPYDGGQLAMLVVVPRDGQLDNVADAFDASFVASMQLSLAQTLVHMPEFDLAQSSDVTSMLESMGMVDAFDPHLNRTEVGHAYLCPIHLQTSMHVDSRGTIAAGTHTEDFSAQPSVLPPPAKSLTVDRPFLFAVRDVPTGTVLFLGLVRDLD